MKKLVITTLMFFGSFAFAQIGTSTQILIPESNWTFGGYAGLGGTFGNGGGVSLYLSPRVGYKLTEDLEMGLTSNFTWQNSKYYSSTIFGVGPFANYYFSRSFFLSGMFQQYFLNQKNKLNSYKVSGDESALYLGGGYMQRLGDRTFMQIGITYNVLYHEDTSFLSSGFIPSIGIVYGL